MTSAAQPSQDWRARNSLQEREDVTEGREVTPGGRTFRLEMSVMPWLSKKVGCERGET